MTELAEIIVGNACSLAAMATDSFSGTRKTKKSILLVQSVTQVFYAASAFVLKGYSAVVQNAVAILRNFYSISGKHNKIVEYSLVLLPVVLGIAFNNRGWLGILPVVANLEYSIAVFAFANAPRKLKYAFIINCLTFSIFNFSIKNYIGGISSIVISITTAISLYKERKEAQQQ